MANILFSLTLFFIFLTQVSCTSSDLYRDKAEMIIFSSREIQQMSHEICMHNTGFKKGLDQDMWYTEGTLWNERTFLTERGKKYFSDIKHKSYLIPLKPIDIEVKITGIADAMHSVKEVQFFWTYSKVDSVIKRFIIAGGAGRAYFRRYDDGWRIEQIETKKSEEAARLSDEESKQEKEDIVSINNEKNERAAKEKEEDERISLLLKKAKTPTETVGIFIFNSIKHSTVKAQITSKIIATDVNLSVVVQEKSDGGGITSTNEYWYAYIVGLDRVYDEDKKYYGLKIKFNRLDLSDRYAEITIFDDSEEKIFDAIEKIQKAINRFKEIHQEAVQMRFR